MLSKEHIVIVLFFSLVQIVLYKHTNLSPLFLVVLVTALGTFVQVEYDKHRRGYRGGCPAEIILTPIILGFYHFVAHSLTIFVLERIKKGPMII